MNIIRFLVLFSAALFGVRVSNAQTAAVYKSTATATQDQITGNIVVGPGKSITTSGNGTISGNVGNTTVGSGKSLVIASGGTETVQSGGNFTSDSGSNIVINGTVSGTHAQPSGTGDSVTFAAVNSITGLANSTQARARTSTTTVVSPSTLNDGVAPLRNVLAPAQGLVFDGTAGATVANVPTFGTGDFTVVAFGAPNLGADRCILSGTAGAPAWYALGAGPLRMNKLGTGSTTDSTAVLASGKPMFAAYARASGTGFHYVNGIAGGSTVDIFDYTVAISRIGTDSSAHFVGPLRVLIYNRALSAAEVLALYESGAPAATDYNSADGTSLVSGADSDFSGTGSWGISGTTTISGGKLNLHGGDPAHNALASLALGRGLRFTITIDSLTAGVVQYYNGVSYVTFASAPGTYTVDFVALGTYAPGLFFQASGGNAVLDTFLAYKTGLLCAPESNAPGNGSVWHDVSGNAADIILPATGVSWNLPNYIDSPLVEGYGRFTAQTAAKSSVATYTVGSADESLLVSGNVLVTTSTTHSFSIECAYTDEGNTARVVTFNVQQLGGTLITAITNVTGVGPYEGIPIHIRAKTGTTVTIRTNSGGTYTSVAYNVEGAIQKLH